MPVHMFFARFIHHYFYNFVRRSGFLLVYSVNINLDRGVYLLWWLYIYDFLFFPLFFFLSCVLLSFFFLSSVFLFLSFFLFFNLSFFLSFFLFLFLSFCCFFFLFFCFVLFFLSYLIEVIMVKWQWCMAIYFVGKGVVALLMCSKKHKCVNKQKCNHFDKNLNNCLPKGCFLRFCKHVTSTN